MAKHNSLDDINMNVRGGFVVPARIPRTKAPQTEIPTTEIPVPKADPFEKDAKFGPNTKTLPKAGPSRSRKKSAVGTKVKPKRERGAMKKLTTMYGSSRGFSPTFRGGPPNSDQPGEDAPGVSLPAGEIPYLDGPRVELPSEKFTGIHELDQLDQTMGDWSGKPSQIRTLYQAVNIQAYPQYGGIKASANSGEAALANVSQTQDQVFFDHYSSIVEYYSRTYTVNKSFEDNFTANNFFLYLYDNSKVLSELLCLLQRSAYYQSEKPNYTENASVEKLANVLNTTNFYPIRNKMARAIKRQYVSKEMMDEIRMLLQTYRLTPHETGGTCFNVTDKMQQLIEDLAGASNEQDADTGITNYVSRMDTWCDYILYGRPQQSATLDNNNKPRRNVNGTRYDLFADASSDSELTVSQRNAISAILARVSGERGPFDYVKCSRIPQGNSESKYDPAFCDRFNNGLAVSRQSYFPPMLCGTLDGDKPALNESVYFASERDSNNQDERTAFHMLTNVSGESPIFYDASRRDWSRGYLLYIGRNTAITSEEKDLTYQVNEIYTIVNNSTHPPVQDNFVTKLYATTNSNRYFAVMPDGDASALFFLTYANMVEQFKKRYIVDM